MKKTYALGLDVLGHGGGGHGHGGGRGRGFWGGGWGWGDGDYEPIYLVDDGSVPVAPAGAECEAYAPDGACLVRAPQVVGVEQGFGIRDGRAYGPYRMGYYNNNGGVALPLGPNGERLPSSDYDFQPGPKGYLTGRRAPRRLAPGVTWCDATGKWGRGAAPSRVAGDVGYDISAVNAAVRGVKPMSVAQAHRFCALGVSGLNAANGYATGAAAQPGITAKRTDLIRQLRNIDASIDGYHLDPLPESAAEILRNAVLEAIAEYNQAAESSATLAAAREQFVQDMEDNAKAMVKAVGDAAANAGKKVSDTLDILKWVGIGLGVVVVVGGGAAIYHNVRSAR